MRTHRFTSLILGVMLLAFGGCGLDGEKIRKTVPTLIINQTVKLGYFNRDQQVQLWEIQTSLSSEWRESAGHFAWIPYETTIEYLYSAVPCEEINKTKTEQMAKILKRKQIIEECLSKHPEIDLATY